LYIKFSNQTAPANTTVDECEDVESGDCLEDAQAVNPDITACVFTDVTNVCNDSLSYCVATISINGQNITDDCEALAQEFGNQTAPTEDECEDFESGDCLEDAQAVNPDITSCVFTDITNVCNDSLSYCVATISINGQNITDDCEALAQEFGNQTAPTNTTEEDCEDFEFGDCLEDAQAVNENITSCVYSEVTNFCNESLS